MKIRLIAALGAFLFFLSSLAVHAERVYILYDAACMDRLEYKLNRPDGRSDFISYHVNVRPGEKLVLEVGSESNQIQNYLPEFYLTCNNSSFDESMMARINNNTDQVYVIYPRNNKTYYISPVSLAARYMKTGNTVTYQSPKYSFQADLTKVDIGANISYNNPGATVYFEGRVDDNACNGSYVFRQLQPQSAYPLIDVTLIPEIGIVEERSGPNATAAMNNRLELDEISDDNVDKYLRNNCGQAPGTRRQGPPSTVAQPTDYFRPTGVNTTANTTAAPVGTAAAPAGVKVHTVKKGETLYGISKANGISVDQIKAWNNLSTNTIRSGQQLQVTAGMGTNPATTAPVTPATRPNEVLTGRGPVTNPGMTNSASNTNMTDMSEYHVVRAGETVASIAMAYGYTEAKFREINGMGTNEFIRVGQRIKVSDCQCPDAAVVANPQTPTNTTTATSTSPGRILPSEFRPTTAAPYNQPGARLNAGTPVPTPNSQAAIQPGYNPSATATGEYRAGRGATAAPATDDRYPTNYNNAPAGDYSRSYNNPNTAYNQPNSNQYTPPPAGGSTNPYNSYSNNDFDNSPYSAARTPQANNAYGTTPNRSMGGLERTGAAVGQPAYDQSGRVPQSYNAYGQSNNQTYNPYATNNNTNGNRRVHIVQQGETIYGISQLYSIPEDQLRRLNSLSPGEVILPYMRLYLD